MNCFSIPKIELHAHLSGSLSDALLQKLLSSHQPHLSMKELSDAHSSLKLTNKRSLAECFEIFKLIHKLTNDVKTVKMMTYEVIKEFHEDNVWYLELRTTPKSVSNVYTKLEYLEGVLASLREAEEKLNIVVRLLISVDRGRGITDAWDTLSVTKMLLGHEEFGKYICGLDISGNPNCGSLVEYLPILKEARALGLKLAIHLLEVNSEVAFDEARLILNENLVDRIGHATFLHFRSGGSETLTDLVKERKIPLEICITSNLKCGSVATLEQHHAKLWARENHPICICTDDKGVFSTTLSQEMGLYQQLARGSLEDIKTLTISSLKAGFLQEENKEILLEKLNSFFS